MDTILYVGGTRPRADGNPLGLSAPRRLDDGALMLPASGPAGRPRRFFAASDPVAALSFIRHRPVDALVVDTRVQPLAEGGFNPSEPGPFALTRAGQFLAGLYPEGQLFAGIPRDRVIGLVGEGPPGAQAAYHLGTYRIGTVLTDPSLDQVVQRLDAMLDRHTAGRIALCLAGGGIEGLFYEIGVLRALDWFLADRSVVDLDLFCGISAGAVLGSFLANGIGPEEIGRGLSGGSARIERIKRSDMFDPNFKEIPPRLRRLAQDLLRGRARPRGAVVALSRALPSAVFAGDRFREFMRRQLNAPGVSDRFDRLRRPLFVGATDQDTSQPVVFGEEGMRHVPIHRAVRASSALVPFYAPEQIDGRHYIDGAFSRTTNMRVAIRQGGTLVILVDPLVPVFSEQSGYVHMRGGMYGAMQGLKALVNGRFDKAVRAISEMFPDVSFWLFRPDGDEMRILSGSPMKYFYRREVEDIAFHNTVRKFRACLPEITRDFARRGVTFSDPETEPNDRRTPVPFEPSALGVEL